MWARIVEFMIAVWLALSPFIFSHPSEERFLWINDFVCACLVASFALLSFWLPLRKIHLLTIIIALWLWSLGYSTFPEKASPALQNSVVVGLLFFMLAIVPSHSNESPLPWKEFIKKKRAEKLNASAHEI